MIERITRGLVGALCAATAGTLALGLAAAPASAQTVHPASSTLDGNISQAEVISRGNDWLKHHFAYDQSKYQIDRDHDYSYRLDCSGYANMMLHSKSNFNTDAFDEHARLNKAFYILMQVDSNNRSKINPSTIHSGDLFDDVSDGHMFVFGEWKSSTEFTYYSFGTGYTDTDTLKVGHPTNKLLGGWDANHYEVIRYRRVTS